MKKEGLEVERPIAPISLKMSEDQEELADPHAYPVKVRRLAVLFSVSSSIGTDFRAFAGCVKALGQRSR
jgi:hypothetical protein